MGCISRCMHSPPGRTIDKSLCRYLGANSFDISTRVFLCSPVVSNGTQVRIHAKDTPVPTVAYRSALKVPACEGATTTHNNGGDWRGHRRQRSVSFAPDITPYTYERAGACVQPAFQVCVLCFSCGTLDLSIF